MKAEKFFNTKLDSLAANLSLDIEGKTFSDRLLSLHQITRDPFHSEKAKNYANFLHQNLISDARNSIKGNPNEDLKPLVTEWLFIALVMGMIHIYPANDYPKTHHWLPVAYIKPFGQKGNGKIRAFVEGVSFFPHGNVDVVVKDVQFAHNRGKGYDLSLESFFFKIESEYSNPRWNSYSKIATTAFFLAQSVRNPHPENGFVGKDTKRVVNALMKNIDSMDKMYGIYSKVWYRLPISPYTPVKVRMLPDGSKAFVLPVQPSVGFVLSDKPLSDDKARNVTRSYQRSVVLQAQKENSMVFGLSSNIVDHILQEEKNNI